MLTLVLEVDGRLEFCLTWEVIKAPTKQLRVGAIWSCRSVTINKLAPGIVESQGHLGGHSTIELNTSLRRAGWSTYFIFFYTNREQIRTYFILKEERSVTTSVAPIHLRVLDSFPPSCSQPWNTPQHNIPSNKIKYSMKILKT